MGSVLGVVHIFLPQPLFSLGISKCKVFNLYLLQLKWLPKQRQSIPTRLLDGQHGTHLVISPLSTSPEGMKHAEFIVYFSSFRITFID